MEKSNRKVFIKLLKFDKYELARLVLVAANKTVDYLNETQALEKRCKDLSANNNIMRRHIDKLESKLRKLESEFTGAQLLIGKMSLDIFQSWDGPKFPKSANPFRNPTPWKVDYEENTRRTDSGVED